MPYPPIKLPSDVPLNVRVVVELGIDPMLREVHTMLSVVIPDPTYHLQSSIANMLLAVISGASSTLYAKEGTSIDQFTGLLIKHFPWDLDPPEGASPDIAAHILWEECRNPLAHRVGLRPKGGRIVKFGLVRGKTPDEVDALAVSVTNPRLRSSLIVRSDATVLWVDTLYWSIRRMIENMMLDRSVVLAAENWMRKLGFMPQRLRKAPKENK